MVSFVLAGIFDVAVAVALISSVARLLRRDGSAVLPSYLFYLVFWYALVFYMLVFLFSPQVLPDGARREYLMYNSIFIVPIHGLTAFFFVDFIFKLLQRPVPRLLKFLPPLCFLLILVFYAREMLTKLSTETTPSGFVLTAPFSGYLLMACIFGGLVYAWISARSVPDRERAECISRYALVTGAGFVVGVFVVSGSIPFVGTTLTSVFFAAVNIPGWGYLRGYFEKRELSTAAAVAGVDLSLLESRYGVTPREREVISLVLTGRSNREITEELFISPETVKKHIYNAYRKIGVRNRVQLVNAVLDNTSERS